MHRLLIILFLVNICSEIDGQSNLPKSIVNFGGGVGINYGVIGTKTVIGYKNSGLLIGLGYLPNDFMGYEIGGQVGFGWFFANIGYGTYGTKQVGNASPEPTTAGCFVLGGMINLGKEKRTFIDLGVGHTFGASPIITPTGAIDQNVFTINVGICYRFGNWEITDKQEIMSHDIL